MRKILWAISILAVPLAGCGSDQPPPLDITGRYGGIKSEPSPPCELTILKPSADQTLPLGKEIPCRLRVVVPPGGKLPTLLRVSLLRPSRVPSRKPREITCDTQFLTLLERMPDGAMVFSARLEHHDDQPGRYAIQAEGTDVFPVPHSGSETEIIVKQVTNGLDRIQIEVQ
jgi:hypothetical protein